MYKLYTIFPSLRISPNPSEEPINKLKIQYVSEAHSSLKQKMITKKIFFPCYELTKSVLDLIQEVLCLFNRMVIYLVKDDSNPVYTFIYNTENYDLEMNTFESREEALAFHYKVSTIDVNKMKTLTQQIFK
jgi:hypothetical protein